MTDPINENSAESPISSEEPKVEAQSTAKPAIRPQPTPPQKPAARIKPDAKAMPSFEELAEGKSTKTPAAPAKPAPTKPAFAAPKPATATPTPTKAAATPKPEASTPTAPDPSISFDDDKGPNVATLIVDAMAAAAAIAFTVLLLQDTLPFLK